MNFCDCTKKENYTYLILFPLLFFHFLLLLAESFKCMTIPKTLVNDLHVFFNYYHVCKQKMLFSVRCRFVCSIRQFRSSNFYVYGFFLNAENSGMRPPTLNIFPSQPMHVEPSSPTKVYIKTVNNVHFLFLEALFFL